MEKGRERYMIPGMLQAVAALDHFGIHELVISDSGLLEGILDSLARNAS
jgi:exopolyphosphatase/pppGpp-phosphohydrolase